MIQVLTVLIELGPYRHLQRLPPWQPELPFRTDGLAVCALGAICGGFSLSNSLTK